MQLMRLGHTLPKLLCGSDVPIGGWRQGKGRKKKNGRDERKYTPEINFWLRYCPYALLLHGCRVRLLLILSEELVSDAAAAPNKLRVHNRLPAHER